MAAGRGEGDVTGGIVASHEVAHSLGEQTVTLLLMGDRQRGGAFPPLDTDGDARA